MIDREERTLVVIENGLLTAYLLDEKRIWNVGRLSSGNVPDIRFHSETVSRKHGCFQNIDEVWFYVDDYGRNGTVYNGKHMDVGYNGRRKPIALQDGDILIFGGGKEAFINRKTVWALYTEHWKNDEWVVKETKECNSLLFVEGNESRLCENLTKGEVIRGKDGMAIYMGDVTYVIGKVSVSK